MKFFSALPLFWLILLPVAGRAQLPGTRLTTGTCNCFLPENYRVQVVTLVKKYETLTTQALNNSEDRRYTRRKYHKKCGGTTGYYFRKKLERLSMLLRPVIKNKHVVFLYEDELTDYAQTRYTLLIKLPDNEICTISWIQDNQD